MIAREIKRLDNVVKTFLTFNRPIELQARPLDLDQVVQQVLSAGVRGRRRPRTSGWRPFLPISCG